MEHSAKQFSTKATVAFGEKSGRHRYDSPRLLKTTINVGTGRRHSNGKDDTAIIEQLITICGQKPAVTTAKQSIAGFKVREGQPVGLKLTLRGQRSDDFAYRLINVALPRVRDFRGIEPRTLSGNSLSLGIEDSLVFPEVSPDSESFGMTVTLTTSAKTKAEAVDFFGLLGFPFKK